MAGYIKYDELDVNLLREYAVKRNLSDKGSKSVLVKRLIVDENKYDEEFNKLHNKYVPAKGSAETRQGKLLRLVGRLMYRYYNDGDTFSVTIGDYPEPYNDLTLQDKNFVSNYYVFSYDTDVRLEDKLNMVNIMRDTVDRVKEIERQTMQLSKSPKREKNVSQKRVSKRCKGVTVKGTKCKKTAVSGEDFCYVHLK